MSTIGLGDDTTGGAAPDSVAARLYGRRGRAVATLCAVAFAAAVLYLATDLTTIGFVILVVGAQTLALTMLVLSD